MRKALRLPSPVVLRSSWAFSEIQGSIVMLFIFYIVPACLVLLLLASGALPQLSLLLPLFSGGLLFPLPHCSGCFLNDAQRPLRNHWHMQGASAARKALFWSFQPRVLNSPHAPMRKSCIAANSSARSSMWHVSNGFEIEAARQLDRCCVDGEGLAVWRAFPS